MSEPKPMMTEKQADALWGKLDTAAIAALAAAKTPADSTKAKKFYGQMLSCADALRKAAGVRL